MNSRTAMEQLRADLFGLRWLTEAPGISALLVACAWLSGSFGELHAAGLEWVSEPSPQVVFEGQGRLVRGVFRNSGKGDVEVTLRSRLWLTSSATATPVGPSQSQRVFRIPGGQSVIEEAAIDFPTVKAKTSFIVTWMDAQDTVIGKTRLLVFPSLLLKELKTLAGDAGLGILDQGNRIKPWLEKCEVSYIDLEKTELENFTGKLVIFSPGSTENERTKARLLAKAASGTAVVWLRHYWPEAPRLEPSSFLKTTTGVPLLITDSALFTNFEKDPTAHLNLVKLARWAVRPENLDEQ